MKPATYAIKGELRGQALLLIWLAPIVCLGMVAAALASFLTPGQHVFAGATLIGSVDSTGHSSGDHLHIGVKNANGDTVWGSSYYDYTKSQPTSFVSRANGGC